MGQFRERIEALSEKDQEKRYQRLVDAALQHYDLGKVTPHFIQYNGGVSYRLVGANDRSLYLLKIAESAAESGGVPLERMELLMEWLTVLARSGEMVVQEPVTSIDCSGEVLTAHRTPHLGMPGWKLRCGADVNELT